MDFKKYIENAAKRLYDIRQGNFKFPKYKIEKIGDLTLISREKDIETND